MNDFHKNLKHYRTKLGITQKQMADELDMKPNAYQLYEYGKREPRIDTLIKIASILGVSLDELVLGNKPQDSLMDLE